MLMRTVITAVFGILISFSVEASDKVQNGEKPHPRRSCWSLLSDLLPWSAVPKTYLESINKSIFEVIDRNIFVTLVIPQLDLRELQALSCTSTRGRDLVRECEQNLRNKIGQGFKDEAPTINENELRLANTLHIPVFDLSWWFPLAASIDGSESDEADESKQSSGATELILGSVIHRCCKSLKPYADGQDHERHPTSHFYEHIYRFYGENEQIAAKQTSFGLCNSTGDRMMLTLEGGMNACMCYDRSSGHLYVPALIGQLKGLQTFSLTGLSGLTLPKEIRLLENLTTLFLTSNNISVFPHEILGIRNLQSLNLQNNQLKDLPENMASLSKLEQLYLGDNLFTEVPIGISTLTALTYLSLNGNNISYIPRELCGLNSLRIVDLLWHEHNKISLAFILSMIITVPSLWDHENRKIDGGARLVVEDRFTCRLRGRIIQAILLASLPVVKIWSWFQDRAD